MIWTLESSPKALSILAQVSDYKNQCCTTLLFPSFYISTTAPFLGVVVRVWVKENNEDSTPQLVTVWAVYFTGLVYLGSQPPIKEASIFTNNALVFGMNWGFFTAGNALKSQLVFPPAQELEENTSSQSYNLTSMCR